MIMALVSWAGLAKVLPETNDWIAAGRRATAAFVAATIVGLGLVLVQEAALFDPQSGTLMATWAIALVVATPICLMLACIAMAVSPRPDPFGWNGRGRQAYVYAAEVLLALAGLHLRMTMPWLFHLEIIQRYWMLLVMAVAFTGAGVSEFFHRRGLPVLSEPLERTALLNAVAAGRRFLVCTGCGLDLGPRRTCPGDVVPDGHFLRHAGLPAALGRVRGAGRAHRQSGSLGGVAAIPDQFLPTSATMADSHRAGAALLAEHLNHARLSAAKRHVPATWP